MLHKRSKRHITTRKTIVMTLILVLVGSVLAGCISTDEKKNKAPISNIESPSDGAIFNTGEEIIFNGNGSKDPEKKPLTYFWEFGDGNFDVVMNATHTYSTGGEYNVSLMVSDGKRNDTANVNVFINTPPIAVINISSPLIPINVNITFDASNSTDADGDPMTYKWEFGDNNTTTGKVVEHTYLELGPYNLTLTVGDGVAESVDTLAIEVFQPNRPPVADFTLTPAAFNNTDIITFNATTTTDLDNDTLTFEWEFGDGNSSTGMVVDHSYEFAGSYTVNLTVSDGEANDTATKVLGVLQKNRAPMAVINVSVDMGPKGHLSHIGEEISFDATESTDADDDSLSFAWDFGDGTNATGDTSSHTYTSIGVYKVNLTVSDGEFDVIASATIDIFPTGEIFVDWDKIDIGYIVELDDDVDKFEVEANITDETTSFTDDDYHTSFLNGSHTVRVFSNITPIPGHIINVTLIYQGRAVTNRLIEVVGSEITPAGTVDVTSDVAMGQHTSNATAERWMNMSGTATTEYDNDHLNRSFSVTDSDLWQKETEGNQERTMTGSFPEAFFNGTSLYNNELSSDSFMKQETNMVMKVGGTWAGEINMTGWTREANNLTTGTVGQADGRMRMGPGGPLLNYTVDAYDTGIEEHDNGDGETYSCIKVYQNTTIHGHFSMPPILPHDHYAIVNLTTSWIIQDTNAYENEEIYIEYNQSMYLINASANDRWELLNSEEGTAYLDEDGDGDYNPDPPILDADEATVFYGAMPRELRVGDKIITLNTYGATEEIEVVSKLERTISGKTYSAVRANSTYGNLGDLDGTGETIVVAEGPLTGLMLETHTTVSYTTSDGELQTLTRDMVGKTIN